MRTDTAVPCEYYVYYCLRAGTDQEDARATIRAMQVALRKRTGVEGRLMERVGDDVTWMEVYANVTDPGAFEAALAAEAVAHDLAALVEPGSARHVERFVACE